MVKVACFDLGGVLVRIAHHWEDAAAHAGNPIRSIETGQPLSIADGFEEYQAGKLGDDEYFRRLAAFLGVGEWQAEEIHNHILLEPYGGTNELIHDLHRAGIETACLSNTNSPHWRTMESSGRFPTHLALGHRFASHELKLQKPDPEIFLAFESALGARGAQIAYFDDALTNVETSQKLGWQSFWIDPNRETVPQIRHSLELIGVPLV